MNKQKKIVFKILTGHEEKLIDGELKSLEKQGLSAEVTTRLRYAIISVDGNSEASHITNSVHNMLSRDSLSLRNEIKRIAPDIDMTTEIESEGESVKVTIPMTVSFFWPRSIG